MKYLDEPLKEKLSCIKIKITPVFIDHSNFSIYKNEILYNGLPVGACKFSEASGSYWLRMKNVADTVSEHNSIEDLLVNVQSKLIEWLEDN